MQDGGFIFGKSSQKKVAEQEEVIKALNRNRDKVLEHESTINRLKNEKTSLENKLACYEEKCPSYRDACANYQKWIEPAKKIPQVQPQKQQHQ
jgi:predicted nuclease with TOPRIM domain